MNILTNNYKAIITNVKDDYLFDVVIDLGFYITKKLRIEIPFIKHINKDLIKGDNEFLTQILKLILINRKVLISTTKPNVYGKSYGCVYIPVRSSPYTDIIVTNKHYNYISLQKMITMLLKQKTKEDASKILGNIISSTEFI